LCHHLIAWTVSIHFTHDLTDDESQGKAEQGRGKGVASQLPKAVENDARLNKAARYPCKWPLATGKGRRCTRPGVGTRIRNFSDVIRNDVPWQLDAADLAVLTGVQI
jgi:hypothetical protein